MTESSRSRGEHFEQLALEYLESNGLKLITRNFHCRFGEIDLICSDGETLVFIEVRFRRQQAYGGGSASVTRAKQLKLVKTANYYLSQEQLHDRIACRFDVVDLTQGKPTGDTSEAVPVVNWIKNAFAASAW